MPSSRRLKALGLMATLAVLVILYVTHGASSTQTSPFYTRTVAAMKARQSAQAREDLLAEERNRLQRVERLEREHKVAMDAAKTSERATTATPTLATKLGEGNPYDRQRPIVAPIEAVGSQQSHAAAGKPVAGRKMMGDGGKVVQDKSGKAAGDDGVAKVGNVAPKSSHVAVEEDDEEHRVETVLNDILKKGPIIVFSKSYCPFSKKAKHILLDLYTINPPPYVVELDLHELGPQLQSALQKMTGRRTVPNILINGLSIGGGDDIEGLHNDGKLIETIQSKGGKRIMKVEKVDDGDKKAEMRFKA